MSDDYTPSMAELRVGSRFTRDEFDRAIAAHDAELRAEIAAQIRASCADKTTCESCEADAAIAEGRP